MVSVNATGAEAASDEKDVQSPETYVGYVRAENFASPGGAVQDAATSMTFPRCSLNEWGWAGDWTIGGESAGSTTRAAASPTVSRPRSASGARTAPDGAPVHFRVTIDGRRRATSHGADTDADGLGVVTGSGCINSSDRAAPVGDHTFKIEFLDPGAQAFAFTFG